MSDALNKLKAKKREISRMVREAEQLAGAASPAARAAFHRDAMAQRSRQIQSAVAEIGQIPPVKDPARRESCRMDLHHFLRTYFPNSTGRSEFSADHKRAIGRMQACILEGGLFGQAFPRGYAKTTMSENGAIWAILYGHRRFIPLFGADANAASGNIDSIKLELAENELLYEDFPEVCHAIRALEGKAQRCASQTHNGQLTHIEWKADLIVLPTIEGSVAGGAILTTRGIESGCRGMKHKGPDGVQQRPDFVILDDPQTDGSASSDVQTDKRLNIIRKSILRLGGHDRRIAVVMNCTVISPGDLVEQIFNPKKFPAWQCERIKMVRKWADAHETLWLDDYARLRNTFDPEILGDQQRAHRAATDFYQRNRPQMDAGCEVSWEHCFDKATELSAIQHAYNILIDDGPEVFASECQNEPLKEESAGDDDITADQISAKLSGYERGMLPAGVSRVVGFIDVGKTLLYLMALGVTEEFTGYVVDYNTYPDQKRAYFAASSARHTLRKATKAAGTEAQIYAGLEAAVGELMSREWKREDGATLRMERILIDANWGESTDVVYQFCRRSPHAAVLLPSHGRFVGATSRPLAEYHRKPGDRTGLNWRMPNVQGRRSVRYVLFDSNAWKSFVRSRLLTPAGARGCLSLFGSDPSAHKLLSDHLVAEVPVEVEAKGRRVIEWKERPSRPDNHYLDCLVGTHVAASIQGVSLMDKPVAARRVSLEQRLKERKVHRPRSKP